AVAGRRAYWQPRQQDRHGDHELDPRTESEPGDDRHHGDSRARPGRALRQSHDLSGRWQAGGRDNQHTGRQPMKAYDLVELAGRNLREAVLRNSLTTMGISVGVASLVAMLSLGVGLQKLATRQLGRAGLFDSIFVTSGQNFPGGGRARSALIPSTFKSLDDGARKTFQKIPA